jgi:hypothetical protein
LDLKLKRTIENVDEFGEVEKKILDLLNAKFPNEVEGYV